MNRSFYTKIIITVVIALVGPILSYTIYQFAQRTENEALITSIYDRQLNTLLFSVNLHCWDQYKSWRAGMAGLDQFPTDDGSRTELQSQMLRFIERQSSMVGLFLKFDNGPQLLVWQNSASRSVVRRDLVRLEQIIKEADANIQKMNEFVREGYARPTILPWDNKEKVTLVLFPINESERKEDVPTLAGLFIDNTTFVYDVVARKFDEMNEGDFVFAVRHKIDDEIVYATTEETEIKPFEIREELWILPHLELMIRLQGRTIEEISTERARWNLTFIVFVNIVLFAGLIYLIRNIFNEMSLAQMKTDFVANVSHELRTPLSLIRMYAETLELNRVPDDKKKMHYYRTIVNESARLTQLINNILDFSRIESRKKEFHLMKSDISEVVNKTIDMYQFHIEMKGFQIGLEIGDNVPDLYMDNEAVTLAFVNLLDNAIKFSGDEKQIDVRLFEQESKVVLAVQDYGIGIHELEHNKIFDKFYRVESSLVHTTKGSGLGLSLVKHIMAIHHGKVTVESKPGKGSTFSLIFPLNYKKGV